MVLRLARHNDEIQQGEKFCTLLVCPSRKVRRVVLGTTTSLT